MFLSPPWFEVIIRIYLNQYLNLFWISIRSHMTHEIHEAYVQRFWMQLLGGSCPKRTVVYSNAPWITALDLGTLKKEYRLEKTTLETTSVGLIWHQQGCLLNDISGYV